MTAQQLDAVKRLASRFGSALGYTDILHNPFGLPDGWVSVVVNKRGTGIVNEGVVLIVAGVPPEGSVHS